MSGGPTLTSPRETLSDLVAVVGSWCDSTDPACWSGADAAHAAEQVAVAIRRLQVKQVALAARAKDANSFSGRFPTAAAWQAHINGCSRSEAKRSLDTVERLDACPEVAAALEAGEISVLEADLVSSAAVVNPGAERRLVEQAKRHNFADTRTAADRARHAVFSREQEQARLARMHGLRRLREVTDGDQLTWVDAHVVPDLWVMVRPILDAFTDAEYRTARQQGRRESPDAYRADGLIAALRAAGDAIGLPTPDPPRPPDRPSGHGPSLRSGPDDVEGPPFGTIGTSEPSDPVGPPASTGSSDQTSVRRPRTSSQPVVLVDAIALRRGWATDIETCELAGTATPISVDRIDDLLPTAAVDVLVHDRNDIRAHARVHRRRPRPPGDGSGPADRPTVVVLIDAVALAHPPPDRDHEGEAIPVPGTDLQMSRHWLGRLVPDDVVAAVERDLTDMRHYTSSTRHIPRPVRLAVLARDRRCTVPGCRARQGLERDHVHAYAAGGVGDSVNMHGTCGDHHDDKTYRDARVVITDTERLWYPPPGTPDHPVHGPTPWRAPLGEHLTHWDLDRLPDDSPAVRPTLPFS